MGLTFNADEIFEIAETIERNGAVFYSQAAEKMKDKAIQRFLLEMAGWEEAHLLIFEEMRKALAGKICEPATYDPDGLTGAYLQALADRRVFDYKQDPTKKFSERTELSDIIKIAIDLEKDSIVFYLGMKALVPAAMGRGKIDDIIKEEMRHIAILSSKMPS
jgi:rubrerythrin